MKKLFISPMLLLVLACNTATENKTITDSPAVVKTGESPNRCYAYISDQDTVKLQLSMDGKEAVGDLVYRLSEKDANNGSIRGRMRGDTLVADYTFTSEGMESVREVRFLRSDDILIEGVGEMEEQNGKMVYKSPNSVRYMGGLVLKKGSCDK
ncbi:hypothetical protein [Sediminibacterium soli]|uniref:hypothetical protein n=1 Tax=Sediminibacterium soli TaxID=2698829 RepID=UPI001379D526|nr:hypothetical protein [Sediminibacterium soli]NCI47771.1 hypothetical protein [Sediminibacterium soli]